MVKYDFEYIINNKKDYDLKTHISFFSNISFIGFHKVEQITDTLHIYVSIPNSSTVVGKYVHFTRKLPMLTEKVNTFFIHSTNELRVELTENKFYKCNDKFLITNQNKYIFAIYATDNTYPKWTSGVPQSELIVKDSHRRSTRSRSRSGERSYHTYSRERDCDYDCYKKRERERDYEDTRDRKRYRSRSRSSERYNRRDRSYSRERKSNVSAQQAQYEFKVPPMVPFSYGVPYEHYGYYGVPHGYPVHHGQHGYPVPHVQHGVPVYHGFHASHGQQGSHVPPPPPGPPVPGQNFSYGNM